MKFGGLIFVLAVLAAAPSASRADDSDGDCGRIYSEWRVLWAESDAAMPAKFARCLAAAHAGDQNAQAGVAITYLDGDAVPQDIQAGMMWLELAVANDGAMALFNLGEMYWQGLWFGSGARDPLIYDKALAYTRRSAALGFARAQWSMGRTYEVGRLLPQDYRIAAAYYQLAADQGYVFAQRDLAKLLLAGKGVKRDAREAARLLHLAAAQESYQDSSAWALANLYAEGRGVERDLAKARHFYEMGIRNVDWLSHYPLGMMYLRGLGGPKNIEEATTNLWIASDAGDPRAQFALGQVYERGIDVPRDIDAARELYAEAAAKGHRQAAARLMALRAR